MDCGDRHDRRFLSQLLPPPQRAWISAALLAFACTGVDYVQYFSLIAHVGPANAIAVTFLIPVFAVTWRWLLLGEGLTLTMLVGCAVIVLGTGLTSGVLKQPRRRAAGGPRPAAMRRTGDGSHD